MRAREDQDANEIFISGKCALFVLFLRKQQEKVSSNCMPMRLYLLLRHLIDMTEPMDQCRQK